MRWQRLSQSRELAIIQEAAGLRTIIGDPNAQQFQPVYHELEAGGGGRPPVRCKAKALKPGSKIAGNRSGGIPPRPGLRRPSRSTLRGRVNNNRYLSDALAFSLRLIMRQLTGTSLRGRRGLLGLL